MIPDVNIAASLGLKPGQKLEPKELATRMQSMFMEVMIKTMEDTVEAEDGLFGNSSSSEMYRGMMREELAKAMTTQVGTNEALSRQSAGKEHQESTVSPDLAEPSSSPSELPVHGRISSEIGWRKDPINGEMRFHKGLDIAAPLGTTIKAVADGRVVESGVKGGYGNAVVIETDDGRRMLYAHNYQNLVTVGDHVSRGESIAQVGATGRATGPHVHFEVTE